MDRKNEWRKMQIVLPNQNMHDDQGRGPSLLDNLYDWHGGQSSAVYALASTGSSHLVSLSMIDAALDDLRSTLRGLKGRGSNKKHLRSTIEDLSSVRLFWPEFSAKEHGISAEGYDRQDYGMDEDEEKDMVKKGEWSNPRKALAGIRWR